MPDGKVAVGVDLGGSNIRAALVDAKGNRLVFEREEIGPDKKPAVIVSRIARIIGRLRDRASAESLQVAGIGIGVAAQIDTGEQVVVVSPNLGWRDVPIGKLFQQELGCEATIINDLEAIAIGETVHGAARGHSDVLVVFVGTGVGGGLLLGGRLYRGSSGLAAEIGHVKVRSGRSCGCGQDGCLEAYLGGANLARRLEEEAEKDWPELQEAASGEINPGILEEMVAAGNRRATALFEELAALFGRVLANAVTLLNPSALVLGGTVLDGCPTLRSWSERVLRQQVLWASGEKLQILKAELGSEAGVVGAAAHVLSGKGVSA